VNSQNRMNAGAEYVLYRIWATLQDQNGIHAESLLTCVGALAGYSCQMYVRQTAALPGADPRKHALLTVDASDGSKYLSGDALMMPLVESSLSVWALVGRAVQKLGKPLPDIQDIVRHVTQTAGTSAFGVPRAPEGHRPRHPAAVYLKLWPQILPIAQRFCRRPMQVPVLFGIALQRAIEHTKDMLSPTLGASIAMECAVAMARVALPEANTDPVVNRPTAVATETDAVPGSTASPALGNVFAPLRGNASATARGKTSEPAPARPTRSRKRRLAAEVAEAGAPVIGALVARVPPAARIVAIASVAFVAVAGAMYQGNPEEAREIAGEPRVLASSNLLAGTPLLAQATQEPQSAQELPFAEEAQVSEETQPFEEVGAPTLVADASVDDSSNEYRPVPLQPSSDGSDEGVMRDEFGQPMR
jgi:hypothetical protein